VSHTEIEQDKGLPERTPLYFYSHVTQQVYGMQFERTREHFSTGHHLGRRQENADKGVNETNRCIAHVSKAGHGDTDDHGQDGHLTAGRDFLSEHNAHGNRNGGYERTHDLEAVKERGGGACEL
jgi:hypothetical protein